METEILKEKQEDLLKTTIENIDFPVEAFPIAIQHMINEGNRCLNFPVDFTGAAVLFAASVAIGNSYKIQVKEGWDESALLFMAIVGKPNTNKSHPISYILKPIFDKDEQTYQDYMKNESDFELKKEGEIVKKPKWFKYLITDITQEALINMHQHNRRGMGVYVDELAGRFKNFNRYHKGSEQEFWISVWSAKQLEIDRKSSRSVFIKLPFVSVIGTIQTSILGDLAKENRDKNGFIDRMLFAFPQNLEKQFFNTNIINPQIQAEWCETIKKILELPMKIEPETGKETFHTLKMSETLIDKIIAWDKKNTMYCRNCEDDALASIIGKFDIHLNRLILILEILNWGTSINMEFPAEIHEDSIDNAIKLVTYFQSTAVCVYNEINSNINSYFKNERERNIFIALPDTFTTNEALKIAAELGQKERATRDYIKKPKLFRRLEHGKYRKLIINE